MGDSVTAGFRRAFAFATSFPATLRSTFSKEMVHDVSVTFLLIPFTIRTQEAVLPSPNRERFDQDFNTVTFLMKTYHHIQDRADFRVSENPPSRSGCFFASRYGTLSTWILHFIGSFFFKCDEELSFFQQSPNQRRSTFWIISGLQEVARIYAQKLAASFPQTLESVDNTRTDLPLLRRY